MFGKEGIRTKFNLAKFFSMLSRRRTLNIKCKVGQKLRKWSQTCMKKKRDEEKKEKDFFTDRQMGPPTELSTIDPLGPKKMFLL